MKDKAVFKGTNRYRIGVGAIGLLLGAALLLTGLAGSAGAAKVVGKDGKVYACYRVAGKQKGSVRLVAKRMHCRRGERKVRWSVAGPRGPAGQNGANGQAGATGASGAAGLETQVTALTTKVESLEKTLSGVTNESLTKALATVNGITNAQLQETVASLADVNALCTQATTLTTTVNSLGTAITGLSLNGVLTGLGGILNIPTVPAALPAFACP